MDKTLEQIRSYAEQGRYKRVPISKELYADAFTPINVMRTLRAASKHCYLLESAEDRQQWGRYSFLGYAPTMEITCTDGRVIISEGHEDEDKTRREVLTDHPGKVLREILEAYKVRLFRDFLHLPEDLSDIFLMTTSNMQNRH